MAIFFVLIKIAMITNESYKNDKIKNLLMVEIAWGAKDVYFIEKKDEKRTPTCKEWDQEYEFKAIYPNEMELGTICINSFIDYKIAWPFRDEELTSIRNSMQYYKQIKEDNIKD